MHYKLLLINLCRLLVSIIRYLNHPLICLEIMKYQISHIEIFIDEHELNILNPETSVFSKMSVGLTICGDIWSKIEIYLKSLYCISMTNQSINNIFLDVLLLNMEKCKCFTKCPFEISI